VFTSDYRIICLRHHHFPFFLFLSPYSFPGREIWHCKNDDAGVECLTERSTVAGSECCWTAGQRRVLYSTVGPVSTPGSSVTVTAAQRRGQPAQTARESRSAIQRAFRAPAITSRRRTPSVRSCQSAGDRPGLLGHRPPLHRDSQRP